MNTLQHTDDFHSSNFTPLGSLGNSKHFNLIKEPYIQRLKHSMFKGAVKVY